MYLLPNKGTNLVPLSHGCVYFVYVYTSASPPKLAPKRCDFARKLAPKRCDFARKLAPKRCDFSEKLAPKRCVSYFFCDFIWWIEKKTVPLQANCEI